MLFIAPELDVRELEVLARIEDLKRRLRFLTSEPRRWQGSLRRLSFARNIRGSNSIEGYDAALDDAAAVALGEEPLDASTETRLALSGYRNAMTYVLQLAQDSQVSISLDLIRSLHFMMTQYDLKIRPGRWRAGSIYVRDDTTGEIVHEGVDIDLVPPLMEELVTAMSDQSGEALIRAAMAHLNLVMVHPFRDGNGRMARTLQSLVLAADGTLSPVFMSVEEYLGRNTQDYYDILAEVGGGSWHPDNDARPWIRFMLAAHLRQALTTQRRFRESERLWDGLELLIAAERVPERAVVALFDAAVGLRVRNSTYRASLAEQGEEITDATASRDLRALVQHDLLEPSGEKRGRHYVRSRRVREMYEAIVAARDPIDMTDPFAGSSAA